MTPPRRLALLQGGLGGVVFGFFPLLLPSPSPLCPHCSYLPSPLFLPVSWLLGFFEPVVSLLGFSHYVGFPLAGS